MFYSALLFCSTAVFLSAATLTRSETVNPYGWELLTDIWVFEPHLAYVAAALLIAIPIIKVAEILWAWPDQPWVRFLRKSG